MNKPLRLLVLLTWDLYALSKKAVYFVLFSLINRLMMEQIRSEDLGRILVVKSGALGDFVLAIPALKTLRREYAGKELVLVVSKNIRVFAEDLAVADKVILEEDVRAVDDIRRQKFDMVVFLNNPGLMYHLRFLLAGVKYRVGHSLNYHGFLLTTPVKLMWEKNGRFRNIGDIIIDVPEAMNPREIIRDPSVKPNQKYDEKTRKLFMKYGIMEKDFVVCISPCVGTLRERKLFSIQANPAEKRQWSGVKYAQLADYLTIKYNAKIVFLGSPLESEYVDDVIAAMKEKNAVNLCNESPIQELPNILVRCSLLITNDTGPMHLASAVNVPLVVIFGYADPAVVEPFNCSNILRIQNRRLHCVPCMFPAKPLRVSYLCDEPLCIKSITVEDVIKEVDSYLKGKKSVQRR
jgi:heptosyltransferase-2